MGNGQHRYLSNNDAIEIIGSRAWTDLRVRLERSGRQIDLQFFSNVLKSRFERMPNILIEALYRAFATDLQSKLDVDVFIATYSVLCSEDKGLILKFLARVYEAGGGIVDRRKMEDMLQHAYGERLRGKSDQIIRLLDSLFRKRKDIPVREFEAWQGRLDVFSDWIMEAMYIFMEPLPPKLERLHRKYISLDDYQDPPGRLPPPVVERLRKQFTQCATLGLRPVLQLSSFKSFTSTFLSEMLAEIVFISRCESLQAVWRLGDFIEHAVVYSMGSRQARCAAISAAVVKYDNKIRMHEVSGLSNDVDVAAELEDPADLREALSEVERGFLDDVRVEDRPLFLSFLRILHILAHSSSNIQSVTGSTLTVPAAPPSPVEDEDTAASLVGVEAIVGRKRAYSLNASLETADVKEAVAVVPVNAHSCSLTRWYIEASLRLELPTPIIAKLKDLLADRGRPFTSDACVNILLQCYDLLPGLKELSLSAACLQGVQPASPLEEKEFIVELTLRHLSAIAVSNSQPYGPPDTEWCVIARPWMDRWRMYVGQQYGRRPGPIENAVILQGRGLRPNITIGQEAELISPQAFSALQLWYGGGPMICRRVVPDMVNNEPKATLELYPLAIQMVLLDVNAKLLINSKQELLFSAMATVAEVSVEVAEIYKLPPENVRLWDYRSEQWKEQQLLVPSHTLREAGIVHNQRIAIETCRTDGTWPRAQMQSALQETEDSTGTSADSTALHRPKDPPRRNDGLVGLDNMGNTCYLNASLQALLHTDIVVEYFLGKHYLRDLNVASKHSFQGRLAKAFAQLVQDVHTSTYHSFTPRAFHHTVCALRDQFAGNDQHDAHEVLAFLLDGLSEDLNLITDKPYTEHPDSDERPDAELAAVWWENHLKRERSLLQLLFAGQFKSVMTCECGYSSSRFEVFNFLSLPLPEPTQRAVQVLVIPRNLSQAMRCVVHIPRRGVISDVVDAAKVLLGETAQEGVDEKTQLSAEADPSLSQDRAFFIAGEVTGGRIRSFVALDRRVETIRDGELLTLFQVLRPMPTTHPSSANGSPNRPHSASTDAPALSSEELAALAGVAPEAPPTESPSAVEPHEGSHLARVAFCQRRVRLVDGSQLGLGGYDFFRPEPFGLPMLEVLPSVSCAAELYDLMESRLRYFLQAPVGALIQHHAHMRRSSPSQSSLSLSPSPTPSASPAPASEGIHYIDSAQTGMSGLSSVVQGDNTTDGSAPAPQQQQGVLDLSPAPADRLRKIQSVHTDEVVAGPLPRRGFTLRLVSGGGASGIVCSKCSWAQRCQGCVIPDRGDLFVTLQDGESIAVDWHFVVLEDLVDASAACQVRAHQSAVDHKLLASETAKVHLDRCLDKFTERERLDSVVCPRCHEDSRIYKTLMLWRLPPVLVIQLKRFQFDRTSRRKLTQTVSFPLEGLDLSRYLVEPALDPATYDLYCVIHHIGALGGGHYIATVRQKTKQLAGGDGSLPAEAQTESRWYCLNDNLVSDVTDLKDLTGPSAYLLFYIRRDWGAGEETLRLLLDQLRANLPSRGPEDDLSAAPPHGDSFTPETPPRPAHLPLERDPKPVEIVSPPQPPAPRAFARVYNSPTSSPALRRIGNARRPGAREGEDDTSDANCIVQ